MVQWLNKKLLFFFSLLILGSPVLFSQEEDKPGEKDYKDPEQFDKFYKRRKVVAAWQINQLKDGALVVKLKTNKHVIDAFLNQGDLMMAEKKRLEMLGANLNLTRAFRNSYKFSKVYFVYNHSGDSLLSGIRSGIFLDTNLVVDPSIVMKESFYILSETDCVYNSSIGFLPEDSAKYAVERGNPTITNVPIVLKNKFGHQLKRPLPIFAGGRGAIRGKDTKTFIFIDGVSTPFYIEGLGGKKEVYVYKGMSLVLSLPKNYTYTSLTNSIDNLNTELEDFYRRSPKPNMAKYPNIKPFLY